MTDGVEENKELAWNYSRKKWNIRELNFRAKDRNQTIVQSIARR